MRSTSTAAPYFWLQSEATDTFGDGLRLLRVHVSVGWRADRANRDGGGAA
jgi:hypothetical protein